MAFDPFALWRNKDPLTLGEAMHLLCDLEPGRTFDHHNPDERQLRDRVKSIHDRVIQAIRSGELCPDLAVLVTPGPYRPANDGFGTTQWLGRDARVVYREKNEKTLALDDSVIPRAALMQWAHGHGLRPEVWEGKRPNESDSVPANTGDWDHEVNPKSERTYLSIILALAVLADVDLTNPHGGEKEGNGTADILAGKIASMGLRGVLRRTIGDRLSDAKRMRDG